HRSRSLVETQEEVIDLLRGSGGRSLQVQTEIGEFIGHPVNRRIVAGIKRQIEVQLVSCRRLLGALFKSEIQITAQVEVAGIGRSRLDIAIKFHFQVI